MYLLIPPTSTLRLCRRCRFTSHYVSINSIKTNYDFVIIRWFTSHYVSINSVLITFLSFELNHLHPTMYLLILWNRWYRSKSNVHLHPTMYLLIPIASWYICVLMYVFTSHYVSINSATLNNVNMRFFYIYIPLCIY